MPARKRQWKIGTVTLDTDEAIDYMLSSDRGNSLLDTFEADFNVRNTAAGVLYAYNKDAYYDEAHAFYRRMAQVDPEGFAKVMGATEKVGTNAPMKPTRASGQRINGSRNVRGKPGVSTQQTPTGLNRDIVEPVAGNLNIVASKNTSGDPRGTSRTTKGRKCESDEKLASNRSKGKGARR